MEVDEAGEDQSVQPVRRLRQTRRQRKVGGRPHQYLVRLSDEEKVQVEARAISLGVKVQTLFVESVLHGGVATVSERHQLYRELTAVRRLVAALGNNVNQLARIANSTGYLEPETGAAMEATRRAVTRLDGLLAAMSAPPDRSIPWTGENGSDVR
jgi:hypothetical protein